MTKDELVALRIAELISHNLSKELKDKDKEKELLSFVKAQILGNFEKEQSIIGEAQKMMEDLLDQGHEFERRTMLPLLKEKLAKKQGFIL